MQSEKENISVRGEKVLYTVKSRNENRLLFFIG